MKWTPSFLRRPDGTWQATIPIPTSATVLNLSFTNGSAWDNNGGANWNPTEYVLPVKGPNSRKRVVSWTRCMPLQARNVALTWRCLSSACDG